MTLLRDLIIHHSLTLKVKYEKGSTDEQLEVELGRGSRVVYARGGDLLETMERAAKSWAKRFE